MKVFTTDRYWMLIEEDAIAAFLILDIWGRLEEVILSPSRPGFAQFNKQRDLEVLQMAASYIMRQAQGNQATPENRQISDGSSSYSADSLSPEEFILPAVTSMTAEELLRGFERLSISVATGEGEALATVIKIALSDLGLGIGFALGELTSFSQPQMVTFTAPDQQQFYAWMWVHQNRHIIPADHPEARGMTQAFSVKGGMDSLVNGQAVRSVFAPQGSSPIPAGGLVSTWSRVAYPFCGTGSKITLGISGEDLLSLKGMEELKRVLMALLGVNNTYVVIIGGFNCPYTSPDIVARAAGIPQARGIEDWCVWAYETLAREDRLNDAYIPDWFFTEGWLDAYRQYGS